MLIKVTRDKPLGYVVYLEMDEIIRSLVRQLCSPASYQITEGKQERSQAQRQQSTRNGTNNNKIPNEQYNRRYEWMEKKAVMLHSAGRKYLHFCMSPSRSWRSDCILTS